jgi:pimeloyl-ACP methyl ester carboxylesterase
VSTSPTAAGPVERAIIADLGPTFRERTVPAAGATLRVLEGGEGPPLVLLHGRGSAAPTWFPLLPELARTRRVLAVDLPGFGVSRGYRFAGGGVEAARAFFAEPLEAWLAAEGVEAPVIVGHSLGGAVAIELALRGRVRLSALGLIAAMGVGPQMALAARVLFHVGPERLARALGPQAFVRVFGAAAGPDRERLGALSGELYAVGGGRPDAAAAFNALVPLTGPVSHRRARLREIEVPTLVLWGDGDEVFPSPLAIAAATELPRGMLRVERGGHAPHQEDPARALALLGELFAAG